MTERLKNLKTVLWALVGVLAAVSVIRYAHGLGAVTNLSDATPWGLWIGFDVMSGVALAAGGFVLAGIVYIFGLERYRPFVRAAILTASSLASSWWNRSLPPLPSPRSPISATTRRTVVRR